MAAGQQPPSADRRCLDDVDVRALTQSMTVLDDAGRVRGADDLFAVVSESSREYLVDHRDGVCECPDYRYRERRCKHIRRVDFATGTRPVPADQDDLDVDPQLGEHVRGEPVFEEPDRADASPGHGSGRHDPT